MALDEKHRSLFVAARRPATLLVFDMDSGREVARFPGPADSDDMWYDATRGRIYVPGGEGLIFVYQQADPDHYTVLAKVPSTIGGRTSAISDRSANTIAFFSPCPGAPIAAQSYGFTRLVTRWKYLEALSV